LFRIVKPFDKVEYLFVISWAIFDRGDNFFHVVLLTLLDIICLLKHLARVLGGSVFACSVRFRERYVEEIVDLSFPK